MAAAVVMEHRTPHFRKRAFAYLLCALFLGFADFLYATKLTTSAAPAYTPYANSVSNTSGIAVGDANNATGAPDGQTAGLAVINATITLDMGAGEEGTQTLKVYFGTIQANSQLNVAFLDANQNIIRQENRDLFFNNAASTATFGYDWHDFGKAYRYVRLTTQAGGGLNVDAVEALGFIGSTASQDTDGDGIPDRQDAQPLVFNAGGGSGAGGSNPALPTNTNRTRTTTSTQINNPVASADDRDGDQIPNNWETDHGLNPDNKDDGKTDPDHDGLNNLQEYQANTDPHKMDTDGDGIPDGWEVKHGLNPLKNDANEDPDGDYLNNLGEYHFGTNPYRADKVTVNGDGSCTVEGKNSRLTDTDWLIFYLLLSAALLSFLIALVLAAAPSPSSNSSKFYRFRHRLYRAFRPRGHVS